MVSSIVAVSSPGPLAGQDHDAAEEAVDASEEAFIASGEAVGWSIDTSSHSYIDSAI